MNKVILIGNLGRDPECTSLPGSGTRVANFSLAVNDIYSGTDGERKEKTTWVPCKAYGKVAEIVENNLHKGSRVALEGKLTVETWEDKQNPGQTKSQMKSIVDRIEFLSTKTVESGENNPEPF